MQSGIIAINKPVGISSAKVVAKVKRLFNAKKAGHTGTLDPFASGVLLCALNKGTRISQFFLNGHKRYRAKLELGVETDTYDSTGQVTQEIPKSDVLSIPTSDIQNAVLSFSGPQDQVPPAFSALKKDGKPLYKLARQGIFVEKPARRIEIYEIKILTMDLPHVDIDVYCSAGTYIRSLAFDIGRKLGCGAHLAALERTRSSQFAIGEAVGLDMLEDMDVGEAQNRIVSLSKALPFIPGVTVDENLIQKIRHGQRLSEKQLGVGSEDGPIRVLDKKDDLLAIVRFDKVSRTYNYSCVFLS